MDFPAEAATSNRQHRLDRICSKKNLRALTGANIGEEVLVPTEEQHTRSVNAPAIHIQSAVVAPTDTQHKNDDTILAKVNYNRLI